jgi:NitT/TauT family transport system permease protein/sulfonate transport system permease protein
VTGASRPAKQAAAHFAIVVVLVAWALGSAASSPFLLPDPLVVLEHVGQFFTSWRKFTHVLLSFAHIAASLAVAFVLGTILALLPHYAPAFRLAVHGRISPFFNSFSAIGWVLLAVLWFGANSFTVVFSIAAILLPFAIVNVREGLEQLDREMMEMGESFSRSRFKHFSRLVLPSLYPFMFATLRVSFGVAWKVALVVELVGGNAGLGFLMNVARTEFDTATILAIIVIIIAFVHGLDKLLLEPLQRRVSRHYAAE